MINYNRRLLALLAASVMVPSASANAQAQVGAIVGPTFSTFRDVDNFDSRTGLLGGLSLVLPLASIARLQPELLFVSKGAEGSNGDEGVRLKYAEVPILLRLNFSSGASIVPHVYAGPYFGLEIDCTVTGATSSDCDDVPGLSTKTVDVGAALGGGIDMDFGPLVLTGGLRYSFGISKVADFEFAGVRESAKNGVFALYAGLGLRLGSRD
jgi:hypothetical protein